MKCPVCDTSESYVEGEYVDVGVGYAQVTPDYCMHCGWCEDSPYQNPQFLHGQLRKCWELQTQFVYKDTK